MNFGWNKPVSYTHLKAMEVFGGNFIEIIIGGAPFNTEVEAFLKMIDFPYTIASVSYTHLYEM